MNPRTLFIQQVESHIRFFESIGAEVQTWEIGPVATDEQIEEMEKQLGFKLPPSLRQVFQTTASRVDFDWVHLADHTEDHELYVAKGAVNWDLARLSADLELGKKWARIGDSDSAQAWLNTLPIVAVGCGDHIGVSLSNNHDVVYLNHESQDGHGEVIAPDFEVFLREWTALMFPGPDWAYFQPFLDGNHRFLSSTSPAAADWPKWLAGEVE